MDFLLPFRKSNSTKLEITLREEYNSIINQNTPQPPLPAEIKPPCFSNIATINETAKFFGGFVVPSYWFEIHIEEKFYLRRRLERCCLKSVFLLYWWLSF